VLICQNTYPVLLPIIIVNISKHFINSGKYSERLVLKSGARKYCQKPDMVTQACTPGYSGGRDQVECISRPIWEKCLQDPISIIGWTWWHVPVIPSYTEKHK
jgi:hypothetical protein